METTFEIINTILFVYKKNGYTQLSNIAAGLNHRLCTTGMYILKNFEELHTPYGIIKLGSPISITIQSEMAEHLKGRYITVCKKYYLITHVRSIPLHYPLVRHSFYTIRELDESLYKSQCMTNNMTCALYDSEIQRLVESGFLTDNLSALKELNEDVSLCNYDRLVNMLCKLNHNEEESVVQFRYTLRKEKYIHIFGLLLLSDTQLYTNAY